MASRRRINEQGLINRVLSAEPELTRAAVNAIVASRNATGTLSQLATLIEAGRIDEAVEAAARAGAISMSNNAAAVYYQSGAATAADLSTVLDVTVDFDQVHDLAVERMRANRLRLVREWTDNQRVLANRVITQGVEEGLNPVDVARNFRANTGLTAYQHQTVENYRRSLERAHLGDSDALGRRLRDARFDPTVRSAALRREPLTQAQIDRMVTRYRERAIKHRAETIGRTEALRSVNAGNQDALLEGVDGGAVAAHELIRIWIAAQDERTRDDHADAHGQEVGLEEPFLVGGEQLMYPGDPSASAEQTVRCRCTFVTRLFQ